MSWHPINLAVCPCCGRDVVRATQFAPSLVWRVVCAPELGGCGARSVTDDTEAGAVKCWNAGLYERGAA